VQTFVSDEWTLEYDLALGPKNEDGVFSCGLAEDVFVGSCLADEDDAINSKKTTADDVADAAVAEFAGMKQGVHPTDDCSAEEVLASTVYAKFVNDGISKAVAAQYIADRLTSKYTEGKLTSADLRARLPKYLVEAIDYVTSATRTKGGISEGGK
jgi:putative ATP-dependent endonuclease of OLD family